MPNLVHSLDAARLCLVINKFFYRPTSGLHPLWQRLQKKRIFILFLIVLLFHVIKLKF